MEAENMFKDFKGLDNGYFVSIIVNTKGKGVPIYVLSYIASQIKESNKIFDIPVIYDLTGNLKGFIAENPSIKNTDTLIQLVCKVNIEISEKSFSEYMERMVVDTLAPFFIGCGFEIISWYYLFNMPQDMKDVRYLEGTRSIIFKEKKITNAMRLIFNELFEMNEFEIDKARGYFDMIGQFRVGNCIKEEQVEKLENFLHKIDINFEIE